MFQPTAWQVGAWQADEAVRVARLSRDGHLFHAAASSPTSSAIARSAALSSGFVVREGVLRGFITTPLLNKDEHKNVATPAWPPAPVHWIERAVPAKLLPYVHLARLHKPIGSWLLAWPGFLSIGLAASPGALPDVTMLALFGVGAVVRFHCVLLRCLHVSAGHRMQHTVPHVSALQEPLRQHTPL